MFHVFPVTPRKDDFGDLCTVCTEHFLFDTPDWGDAPTQGDLGGGEKKRKRIVVRCRTGRM